MFRSLGPLRSKASFRRGHISNPLQFSLRFLDRSRASDGLFGLHWVLLAGSTPVDSSVASAAASAIATGEEAATAEAAAAAAAAACCGAESSLSRVLREVPANRGWKSMATDAKSQLTWTHHPCTAMGMHTCPTTAAAAPAAAPPAATAAAATENPGAGAAGTYQALQGGNFHTDESMGRMEPRTGAMQIHSSHSINAAAAAAAPSPFASTVATKETLPGISFQKSMGQMEQSKYAMRIHTRPAVDAAAAAPAASASASAAQMLSGGGGYMKTGHMPECRSPRMLVTGACGQIGLELVPYLRERFGTESVIASDVKSTSRDFLDSGPFVYADVRDYDNLARIVLEHRVDQIVHLASILSAVGEKNPQLALNINVKGIQNTLELARQFQLRVFVPSTIAVFGPSAPKERTPEVTVMDPTTVYGITKVHLELLGKYYRQVYGVDFRSLRYPGIISSKCLPGGGTTDYAVEIYHAALRTGQYTCFLEENQLLPMMYMPDCLKATVQLIMADRHKLQRSVYNIGAVSFTPHQMAESIRGHIPLFHIQYLPDYRQEIATTWPHTINDEAAWNDWGWKPDYDLERMTEDMLHQLRNKSLNSGA